tara:strand:+ start:359 stop:697 length:339 start_codon:yes stop_codon:yes gene_type:complete
LKNRLHTLLVLLLALAFSPGCSNGYFVKKVEGTDNINLVDNMQSLKECLDKGSNTVRITGYAERLPEYIHEDLIQLSKNAALQMSANTIFMAEFNEKGRGTQSATFNAFLCN